MPNSELKDFVNKAPQLIGALRSRIVSTSPPDMFVHPLGFLYFELFRQQSLTVRLHIWPGRTLRQTIHVTPIHSHDWKLQSLVLCGTITNTVHCLRGSSIDPTHRVYRVFHNENIDYLVPTSQVGTVVEGSVTRLFQSDAYVVSAGELHSTEVDEATISATLLLATHSPKLSAPEVLGPLSGRPYTHRRPRCTSDFALTAVDTVLSSLVNS